MDWAAEATRISTGLWLSHEDMTTLNNASNFRRHPILAVLYYHSTGTCLDSRLYHDESLSLPGVATARILGAMEDPVGEEDAKFIEEEMRGKQQPMPGRVRACASCSELLIEAWGDVALTMTLDTCPRGLLFTEDELKDFHDLSATAKTHSQHHKDAGNKLYHLNPDLLNDDSVITLCAKCCADPRKMKYSIACRHNYGCLNHLVELDETTARTICILRPTCKSQIVIKDGHRGGHVVVYPSSGSDEIASVLPWKYNNLPWYDLLVLLLILLVLLVVLVHMLSDEIIAFPLLHALCTFVDLITMFSLTTHQGHFRGRS